MSNRIPVMVPGDVPDDADVEEETRAFWVAWKADGLDPPGDDLAWMDEWEREIVSAVFGRAFDFNPLQLRDRRGRWAVAAGIGISPFHGRKPLWDPAEVARYRESPRYKAFKASLADELASGGIDVDFAHDSIGLWESTEEPSMSLRLRGPRAKIHGALGKVARKYNQDAVLTFSDDADGPDVLHTLHTEGLGPEAVVAALASHEISGATLDGDTLQVVDEKGDLADRVAAFAKDLKLKWEFSLGSARFLVNEIGRAHV